MSTADILIVVLIIFFSVKGLINGLIMEAISILGIILAFLFSYMAYTPIHKIVSKFSSSENVGGILTYILAFLLIYTIVVVIGMLLNRFIKMLQLGGINRILGFIFGGLKGAVIISIAMWLIIYLVPKTAPIVNEIKSAKLANPIMQIVPTGYDFIKGISHFDRVNPFKK